MAHNKVDDTNVYLCTGEPMPKDINEIAQALLNSPFSAAFKGEHVFDPEAGGYMSNTLFSLRFLMFRSSGGYADRQRTRPG